MQKVLCPGIADGMKFPVDIGFAGWKAKGCFAEREIGNAHIFEAAVSRQAAQKWLIDELPGWFGGRTQTAMAYLAESGKLTLNDVQEAADCAPTYGERALDNHMYGGPR
jgi:hypothetical protein